MSDPYPDDLNARQSLPSRLKAAGSAVMRACADFVVPPACLACQRRLGTHDALCAACWRQIAFIRHPLCDKLGIPLPFDTGGVAISAAAAANPPAYDRARAVAAYDGVVRDLIHALKFHDRHDARRLFGRWLVAAEPTWFSEPDARWKQQTPIFLPLCIRV